MNDDDKRMFLALVKGKDISEIMSLLAESGNQYSRRILRFFRWFCKWVPFFIMLTHMYGMFDFSRNPKEMFVVHKANWACYAFIYIMVYVLPMVIILASRFFKFSWVWRIPFLYLVGVILIRLGHGTLCISETTRIADYTLIILTMLLYGRAFTLQDK